MDTPDRNRISTTSLSKFEDSPVFNYINNLSPIELVKSKNTNHSFNLLSFTSPSSVFASPQIRESRFSLDSNQSPHPLKFEHLLCGNENKTSKGDSDQRTEQLGCVTPGSSAREVTAEPVNEPLGLANELPESMKYGSGSPVSDRLSCDVIERSRGPKMTGASLSFAQPKQGDSGETRDFESRTNLRNICRIEQTDEAEGCDWVSAVSNFPDLLTYDSSVVDNESEEQDQKTVDPGTTSFVKTVLQLPQDNANNLESMISTSGSCKHCEMGKRETQSGEIGDLKDQTPDILSSTLLNKPVASESKEKVDDKEEEYGQSSCKHHNIRRRCLDFEMAGSQKKQVACESNGSSSIPLQFESSDIKVANKEKHLLPSKRGSCCLSSTLPGVGLHLNALATASKECKVVRCETLASGRQLISMRSSASSSASLTFGQNLLNNSSTLGSVERDSVPCDNKDQVIENGLQTSVEIGGEEFDNCSPKRKRFKQEPAGESIACKRCNCKRSKCLKLYCECFAAGLYCVEPCSCLDCFNKPTHEDTVMETRKQIESRNPLAFAPKVIRSTNSAMELKDETKTPASARHKRGCNCKRSNCLKKYCECFQGGVGCSINCRCEGCKNAFGKKDVGAEQTENEKEESEACERNETDTNLNGNVAKKGEEEYPDSSNISRGKRSASSDSLLAVVGSSHKKLCTNLKLGTSKFFQQSKFETRLQVIPEDETPKNSKSNRSQTSEVNSPSLKFEKVLLSNKESVSSTSRGIGRKLIMRPALPLPSVTPSGEQ